MQLRCVIFGGIDYIVHEREISFSWMVHREDPSLLRHKLWEVGYVDHIGETLAKNSPLFLNMVEASVGPNLWVQD